MDAGQALLVGAGVAIDALGLQGLHVDVVRQGPQAGLHQPVQDVLRDEHLLVVLGLREGEVLVKRDQLHQRAHPQTQLVRGDGLGQELHEAGVQALPQDPGLLVPGQHHHGDEPVRIQCLDAAAELDAVQPGHLVVGEDQVRPVLPVEVQGLQAVPGVDDLVAVAGQDRIRHDVEEGIIVGDQDPQAQASRISNSLPNCTILRIPITAGEGLISTTWMPFSSVFSRRTSSMPRDEESM